MKVKKANIEAIYPLRFLQQALLFHSQQETVDQGFLQVQCELKGKIKLEAFKYAWQQTIQRHEFLRTSIHWENLEKPVQVVHKEVSLPFTYYDWSEIKESEQNAKLEKLKNSDAKEKLDLTKSPVLRLFLIKLSEEKHFLLWTCHHLLADGWSTSIILQDLLAFYDVRDLDEFEAELPAIPSYKSYLNWVKKQDKKNAETFWTELLKDFEKPIFVGKQQHSQNKEDKFQFEAIKLSEKESRKLRDFSQKKQITLNTLIQGVWAVMLSQYAVQEDVVFGTIVSGRSINLPNAELMAGMYMNVLPLRIKVDSKELISDWLKTLQLQQAKTREFEYVNLDEVFNSKISAKGKLLFDSLVVFENFPSEDISGGGISIEKFKSGLTSNYAITLAISPLKEIEAYLKYDSSVISEQQITWFTKNLMNLFQVMIENKATTLEELINYTTQLDLEKIQDEIFEADNITSSEYSAPKNDVELKLTGIWETLLNHQPIGVTEDFFEIGGTSIVAIRLFTEIEKEFGKKLQPISLLKHRNIESLSALILGERKEETLSSLVPLRASGTKKPIYCLHAGGGHVFFYKDLAKYLGDDQPVYAIQRLGLDDLTQATQSVKTMATDYLKEVRKVQAVGPYSFLGYCFSTSVVWEMTRQLLDMGETVSLLAMVDSPPHYTDKRTTEEKVGRIVRKLKSFDLSFVKTAWQGKIKHPVKQKWNYLTGDKNDKDHKKIMEALNSNAELYSWKPLPIKVTLLRSDSMMKLPEQNDAVKEWDVLALKGVETFAIGGHHDFLFEEPSVQNLAKQLTECLENANK